MRGLAVTLAVVAAGLAAAIGCSQLAGASETVNYTYDAKGRLVKVVHSGSVNNNVTSNYTYDSADNRNVVIVTGAP